MDGPAIHYNIGVAAYRLQRYDRAKSAFQEVARTPAMAALAHYNLGLIANAEQDERTAREMFTRVNETAGDEKLRALAQLKLEALGEATREPQPEPRIWAGYAAAGLGYDDNVTLTANGQTLGVADGEDTYLDALFAGSLQLDEQWRLDADLSYLKYADLTEFDQTGAGAGGRYRLHMEEWTTDLGAQLALTYIAGERFDLRQSLFVYASRRLTEEWSLRGRYRLSNVDGASQYPGLDGLRHEISARFTYDNSSWTATGGYLFESSDYDSETLSVTRHQFLFDVRKPMTSALTVHAGLGLRESEYDDPTLGSETRIELSAAVEHALDEQWTLVGRYTFTDSNADVPEFDYQRNRLFVGAEAAF